ncbi:alpha/beta hydrolase [Paenibacillus methanolicus]|uniref:Alpha/beta superfamily hydrolase n=1 Tax=Paenibacillus methanolicus TaxID=582686 RepID=A0A5S5C8P2_9BACL|nr:alpha/beta hydrolase-fold protein [Paenibacillus methanolicus]TYP74700.1 hypothetical protein BCM02_105244 [Paenibacillus methanolicus]
MRTRVKIPYAPERCFECGFRSANGLAYRIMVAAPADEPPASGYGVVYALDGDALFGTLAEAVKLQTRKPKGFDPIVVVGIGYPSREPFDMERRCRDFTMPASGGTLPERPDGRPWPPHGGADDFLDFLERELLPAINEEWPIDKNRQAIVGHSLGGLFTLHALLARPHLFSHVIAGSPSVWWADNEVIRELDAFSEAWQGERTLRLLLAIGENELPDMLEGTNEVERRVSLLQDKGVFLERVTFADEEHVSVLPSTLSRIPRFLSSEASQEQGN